LPLQISIIVALSENNVVGLRNQLPWKLSADLKRVKSLTMGHHIIMGRKTFESIGRPLPGRTNVIITRNTNYKAEGCVIASSLQHALEIAVNDTEVFIFGGGEIFKEAMPLASKIYMTRVHTHLEGDTYFPEIKPFDWRIVELQEFKADEKNEFDYSFMTLIRFEAE
jgi:dihydrofolate reductase